jgi:hypothetical protein
MERLERNSAQMRFGPRRWSKIRSDVVQYPISRAPRTLAASVKLHEAIGTPLRLASGKHGGAVAIVEKLRELPLRLSGFVRSLRGRCLVGMMHTGELFEGVRRGEFRIDFRVSHRAEHATDSRAPSRRVQGVDKAICDVLFRQPGQILGLCGEGVRHVSESSWAS